MSLTLQVNRRQTAADGVVVLDLRRPDGGALPVWSPGSHLDLRLGPDLIRQYSLCGDPADVRVWRIAVLRTEPSRGGSQFVHDKLAEGDIVEVDGPRNHFPLEPARRYIFIAGGIGITPIRPMVAAAAQAGAEWELHYGGRSRASMAFSDIPGATLYPQDEVGLIALDTVLGTHVPGTLIYCCGPEPLLRAVEARCTAGTLRVERFTTDLSADSAPAEAFEVELARSGLTLAVPADRSILEVVGAAGVQVLFSCREGTCGTCETTVLDGVVDHRDSLLTAAEQAANDTMFICVSRAAGPRLVLDL